MTLVRGSPGLEATTLALALVAAVQGDKVFFAKNSDRPPNEEQEVVVLPEQEWPEGSQLKVRGDRGNPPVSILAPGDVHYDTTGAPHKPCHALQASLDVGRRDGLVCDISALLSLASP